LKAFSASERESDVGRRAMGLSLVLWRAARNARVSLLFRNA